jgi:cellulose 1,4-beta-cellobiosidase
VDDGGVDGAVLAEAGPRADAPLAVVEAGHWPAELTVSTCQDYASVNVGAYTVQANYWHKDLCPGTQCMEINKSTAAFSVIQGPSACGDTVATYPNVLYGCSFGNCSPGTMLPLPVNALSKVTSSWDFSVGGAASDQYNVAYDIWFCPDDNCGSSGFPKGLEIMIWLDYKNVHGWQNDLGSVSLAGHTWEVWQATMGTGPSSWTYLAYMITSPMVTNVANLDLNAFFKDAAARGYIQNSWYLYAIQAGSELRSGGVPFNNNSFSVSINGVTPTTSSVAPVSGPSCDGGVPTAEGKLEINSNFVTAGALHGYGSAWGWVGADSKAVACALPACNAPGSLQTIPVMGNGVAPLTAEPVSCSPAFSPTALCTAGTVTADPTYNQVAGVGFNLNQDRTVDAGVPNPDGDAGRDSGAFDLDSGTDAGPRSLGTITIGKSVAVSVTKSGTLMGNSALRVQLTGGDGNFYCYGGRLESGVPIPIDQFNTKCWNNSGKFANSSTPVQRLDVLVPGTSSTDEPFAFCITSVSLQ